MPQNILNLMPGSLSKADFDLFLDTLDTNREQAAEKYIALRERLENFFLWRDCENSEELTDIVFDRTLKKINEGEKIRNAEAFCVSIAKFVLLENRRDVLRITELDKNISEVNADSEEEIEIRRKQLRCLDSCLSKLTVEKQNLLIGYFDTEEKPLIQSRQFLAEKLDITVNSLRIRVSRLKSKLEKCTKECCKRTI